MLSFSRTIFIAGFAEANIWSAACFRQASALVIFLKSRAKGAAVGSGVGDC